MEPITTGMQGAAVEDVQSRLLQLGYTIDAAEVTDKYFGATTEQAVSTFRLDSGLAAGHVVDIPCWSALVDASYKLGDRTLYLRMPNFHGADVQALQRALNVLGFACGEDDGYAAPRATIALAECHNLAQRIRTANVAAQQKPARIRIELTGMTRYNGTFTASDAQTLAVRLLDGVCDALAD